MRHRSYTIFSTPIALLTLTTAGIHFYLATQHNTAMLRLGFLAAGIGFVGSLAALLAPIGFLSRLRPFAGLLLLCVDVAAIIGHLVVMGIVFEPLAIADKAAELALLILLITDWLVAGSPEEARHEESSMRAA
ncbi:MAG TPA: hypothetical protein VEQ37_06205 [Actinomycetota bacterium]|nr:hypothetical protein [Actinomycetota bacterium]